MYIKNDFNYNETPYRFNFDNVEITVVILSHIVPNFMLLAFTDQRVLVMSEFHTSLMPLPIFRTR